MLAAENKGRTGTRQTKRSHMYKINFRCLSSLSASSSAHELEGFFYHVSDELQRSTTFTKNG